MTTLQERYSSGYEALHTLVRAIQYDRSVNNNAATQLPLGKTKREDVRKYALRLHGRVLESGTTGPKLTPSEIESQGVLHAWLSVPHNHLDYLTGVLGASDGGGAANDVNLELNFEVCTLAGADQWHKTQPRRERFDSGPSDTDSLSKNPDRWIQSLDRATQRGIVPTDLSRAATDRALTAMGPLVRKLTNTLARPWNHMTFANLYDSIVDISDIRSLPLLSAEHHPDLDLESWTAARVNAQNTLDSAWTDFTCVAGPLMRMTNPDGTSRDDYRRFIGGREDALINDVEYTDAAEAVRAAANALLITWKERPAKSSGSDA